MNEKKDTQEKPDTKTENKIKEVQPDIITIRAYPDHRLQVSYEFKGKNAVQQKEIAISILENTAKGLFKELVVDDVKQRIMDDIKTQMKEPPKIVVPNNFVVPEAGGVGGAPPLIPKVQK